MILSRTGPVGLLGTAAVLATADFLLSDHPGFAFVLTLAECVVTLPWMWLIFHLEQGEARLETDERRRRLRMLPTHVVTVVLIVAALVAKTFVLLSADGGDPERVAGVYRQYVIAFYFLFALGHVGRGSRAGRFLAAAAESPARLMALSFGCVALLGAFVLTLPLSVREVTHASFLEALFTATGAVCGALGINDVAATYTVFGQAVILLLIQLGGLGIMALSAFFSIAARRRLRVKSAAVMAEMFDADSLSSMRNTVRDIVLFTFTIEAVGAVVLYFALARHPAVGLGPESPDPAAGAGSVAWSAVFHSVSAFCTAGFSLSHGNIVPFVGDWPVSLTMSALILLGGIGFPVLSELVARTRTRLSGPRAPRLSLDSRIALTACAILTFGGAFGFLVLEWNRSLAGAPFGTKVLASLFQSVTARTAGFNSVDMTTVGPAALLLLCVLMFIGTSPGATGGGVKTTTVAVLFATFRAEIRGEESSRLFDRRVPLASRRKAIAVTTAGVSIVLASFFLLLLTEGAEPLKLLFEVVSAFSTCGLSAGVTGGLSVAGRIVIIVTMLAGRIGPLTLALAAASSGRRRRAVLAEERIHIG
jgi:trk system potassium uptake protein TrkH